MNKPTVTVHKSSIVCFDPEADPMDNLEGAEWNVVDLETGKESVVGYSVLDDDSINLSASPLSPS
jgi:hypothetical protein